MGDNKALMIVLVVSAIILTACDNGSQVTNYHLGTQGIVMTPLSSNPESVYEGEYFALGMNIYNRGADDVENGILTVNYDDYFIGLDRETQAGKTQLINISGKSLYNPTGGVDYLEYVFNASVLSVIRTSVETNINFNLCYPYNTDLSTETCIDTRTRTTDGGSYACSGKDYTSNSGQGAPISITKIEPVMMMVGDNVKPLFRIYIKNSGQGYTLLPGNCNSEDKDSSKLNRLKVRAWISNDTALICNPDEIRLVEGETVARCYVADSDLSKFARNTVNYVTILRVLLEYDYVETQKATVTVQRVNEIDIHNNPDDCGYYEIKDPKTEKCIPLCDYCTDPAHSNEQACKRNINSTSNFEFTTDFTCACSKSKCLALSKDGQCIFGYCPGSTYCCSSNECRDKPDGTKCGDNYVCKDNKCSNETLCIRNYGALNYTCHKDTDCNQTTIRTGYCPGDEHNVCCKLPQQ